MRLIRRLLLLSIVGIGGVVAFNYVSENGWPRPRDASIEAKIAKEQAERLATRAAAEASTAAIAFRGTIGDSALTAKIKSNMALDDYVKVDGIDVTTFRPIVTLTGVVRS